MPPPSRRVVDSPAAIKISSRPNIRAQFGDLLLTELGFKGEDPHAIEVRERYVNDPVGWVQDKLREHVWSKQRQLMESVRDYRRTAVQSCHGSGKALTLDTPLPTPYGWTTMGEVEVGDLVYDEEGQPTVVVGTTDVHTRPTYRIEFSDGSVIDASDNHLWSVVDIRHRPRKVADWRDHWSAAKIRPTRSLAASPERNGQHRWLVPTARPLCGETPWTLPIGPYTFGAWLGDGTTVRAEITCHRDDSAHFTEMFLAEGSIPRVREAGKPNAVLVGFSVHTYQDAPSRLPALGGHKSVPLAVLRSNYENRLSVLRGWMDTDGNAIKGSSGVELHTTHNHLAESAAELVSSLGWIARTRVKAAKLNVNGEVIGPVWTIVFCPNVCPFTLPRKALQWDGNRAANTNQESRSTQRTIRKITPIGERLVRCIEVASPRHLYLAGRAMIPTHNSFSAARVAAWWLATHEPGEAMVITSAPTWKQIRAVLWREILRAHSKGKLVGRITQQAEWIAKMPSGHEEIIALGLKPQDYDPSAFQGIHARFILVIFDEACGIFAQLWNAADSLISNDESRFLAIGNPDDPHSEFAESCKPGSGWNTIKISAFDTPNFTDEEIPDRLKHNLVGPKWVEEKRKRWGETNPLYIAKVLGEFPDTNTDGLIPMRWIRLASENALPPIGSVQLGVDVGAGGDKTVIASNHGGVVRIVKRSQEPDTMKSLELLLDVMKDTDPVVARVDSIGLGVGIVDRAKQIAKDKGGLRSKLASRIVGVNVGKAPARGDKFVNLRAENYWHLREMFERGEINIDPEDEDLMAQLVDLQYRRTSRGLIQIESKDEMRARGKHSPDDADAVMLSCAKGAGAAKTKRTWGGRRKGALARRAR